MSQGNARLALEWTDRKFIHVYWPRNTNHTIGHLLREQLVQPKTLAIRTRKSEAKPEEITLLEYFAAQERKLQTQEQRGELSILVDVELDAPADAFEKSILTLNRVQKAESSEVSKEEKDGKEEKKEENKEDERLLLWSGELNTKIHSFLTSTSGLDHLVIEKNSDLLRSALREADDEGYKIFLRACFNGDKEKVKYLSELHSYPNDKLIIGLKGACLGQCKETVKYLLPIITFAVGTKNNDQTFDVILMYICAIGDPKILKEYLSTYGQKYKKLSPTSNQHTSPSLCRDHMWAACRISSYYLLSDILYDFFPKLREIHIISLNNNTCWFFQPNDGIIPALTTRIINSYLLLAPAGKTTADLRGGQLWGLNELRSLHLMILGNIPLAREVYAKENELF